MNLTLFPVGSLLLATVASTPASYVDTASQYGALGLMTLALGAFSIWMEKNRRRSDREDRAERREHHDALIAVIQQKDEVIKAKDLLIEKLSLSEKAPK